MLQRTNRHAQEMDNEFVTNSYSNPDHLPHIGKIRGTRAELKPNKTMPNSLFCIFASRAGIGARPFAKRTPGREEA